MGDLRREQRPRKRAQCLKNQLVGLKNYIEVCYQLTQLRSDHAGAESDPDHENETKCTALS